MTPEDEKLLHAAVLTWDHAYANRHILPARDYSIASEALHKTLLSLFPARNLRIQLVPTGRTNST